MRCPDCEKFVPFDELRIDEVEVELNDTELSLSGTVYRPCADCGTDLASAEAEASEDVTDHFPETWFPDTLGKVETEYEIEEEDIQATERTHRGKNHIGVEATVKVKRTVKRNGVELIDYTQMAEVTIGWDEQASAYDSCV